MEKVLKDAAKVAATETTVLLLGESGTGKEVVARFLHRASARHDGPFVALNCAALPRTFWRHAQEGTHYHGPDRRLEDSSDHARACIL